MTKKQKIQALAARPGTEGERIAAQSALSRLNAKPATANQITADLLIEIPKRFPNSICWRNNTGGGVGMGSVKSAIACLKRGDCKGALGHLKRPVGFGLVGSSDIIVIIGQTSSHQGGRFVGIEVKADGDTQSPGQRSFEASVVALGGAYIVARGVQECLAEMEVACGYTSR